MIPRQSSSHSCCSRSSMVLKVEVVSFHFHEIGKLLYNDNYLSEASQRGHLLKAKKQKDAIKHLYFLRAEYLL